MTDAEQTAKMEKEKAIQLGYLKGTVVKLKSGGPKMTVSDVDLYHMGTRALVKTQWFHNDEPKSEMFPYQSLEIIEKAPTTEDN